uniref:Coiled-coil domain containing 88Aa n=1 Tax=Cynoglossus semilaevis TaxID=244447 RepID=A0A3P8VQB4_CYNSE
MEAEEFVSCVDHFMLSPLVTWVRTFVPNDGGTNLEFSELLDGLFLNDVMTQINPSADPQGVQMRRDPSQRIQNLNFLVQQIKTFYLDNLRQLIVAPLPNVTELVKTPCCEESLEEMKKILLLLLGCAVQCEKKELYIERIQTLDFDTKAAVASHIQETIAQLMQEKDGVLSFLSSPTSPQPEGFTASIQQQQQVGSQQHLSVELADSKAKIRRLRQELEEKSEQMLDCRHELENMEADLKRMQQENCQLLVDARAARTYRDELDTLRERAMRADKLESEVGRYREQLHKMEFFKAKVEELKEDNKVLEETKEVLEDQLSGWRARSDKIHQLEKQNLVLKTQIHDMEQEKEADRRRIEELQEENLTLCLAQQRSMEESQHLGWELEQLSRTTEKPQGPDTLSVEVSDTTRSQLLKLEMENQTLHRTIEELRAASISTSLQSSPNPPGGGDCNGQKVHESKDCSLNDENSRLRKSSSNMENGTTKPSDSTASEQVLNGEPNSHQAPNTGQLHEVQSHICVTDSPLHPRFEGDHFKDLMSELENMNNRLHCFVGSRDHSPVSKSNSPCHESIFLQQMVSLKSSYVSKQTQRLEARCKALDTVNQQLQLSVDTSDRKVQRLEAEVQELEAENQSLQANLEELRISARRLEQLETEKQGMDQEVTALEKDKRQLEKENRRLRQQAEIQEASLDSSNVCMASLERELRLLVKEVDVLRETAERVKGLEKDNRDLRQRAAMDHRTLATLREELVCEKLKNHQRDTELERVSHELEMKDLTKESTGKREDDAVDVRFKILESELESSLKKSLQIKDDKIVALQARLLDCSTFNQQLHQELKTVKLGFEALQQKQGEEGQTQSTSSSTTQAGVAVSEWLRESQEATKELLKLKDRLIEVERNNATLEAEGLATQSQLQQLESQCESQQAQLLALQRQAASLQENNTVLQTHNANLQVEKSTLNSQSASLMAQNAQLQQQQSGTETERDSAVREREDLRAVHEQLLRDHERLNALHEHQAMDYEILMGKHGCLKKAHRTLELEQRTLQDRYNNLLQQRTRLEDLEKTLRDEQMRMTLEKEEHKKISAERIALRDERDRLKENNQQLLSDHQLLAVDHKQLKSQLNEAQLKHTWLGVDFSKLKKDFQQLDITSAKISNQCELLSQLKGNLEEENRHLLSQIETLKLQNMESKDLFHVEERQYIDKLNDLRRQKEKLEEKIMDQYKFYEPSPTRRRGSWITLKLKKLMKSSSREQVEECHPSPTHSATPDPNETFISSDGSGGVASPTVGDSISPPPRRNYKDSNDGSGLHVCEDNNELQNNALGGAHSESSGEFSPSLENEPWSNGSSPIQQTPSRRSSSSSYQQPCSTSTPRHKEKAPNKPNFNDSHTLELQPEPKQKHLAIAQDFWLTRGTRSIRKGSGGKMTRRSSDSAGTVKINTGMGEIGSKSGTSTDDTTRALACSPITVLYVQGKSSSMSGCLNCFSSPLGKQSRVRGARPQKSLPRASNVISTAEGSSRRCSVNSDCKEGVNNDSPQAHVSKGNNRQDEPGAENPQPEPENAEPELLPPLKPPRDPSSIVPTHCPKSLVQESLFGTSFTFNSVFNNTIFSDSTVTTTASLNEHGDHQVIFCLDPALVVADSQHEAGNKPQTTLCVDNEQSPKAEGASGMEEKDPTIMNA